MKILATVSLGFLLVNCGFAQSGSITVANSATSLVMNAYTGVSVKPADQINVLLYYAPANTSDPAAFVPLFPSVKVGPSAVSAGRYNGGSRMVPGYTDYSTVSVQMRAFETNYGNTYEEAAAAGPINGRRALVGKSAIAQITLPGPTQISPTTAVCGGFAVDIAGGGPYLTVRDIVVSEGSNGLAFANFKISLLNTQTETVTVDYYTSDGTALAGSDYVATNGTATFAPGENVKLVSVTLIPDVPAEPDEVFYLNLTNVVNGIIARPRAACIITEVRVTNISVDVSLSFNTVVNRRYMVERSTDFITWQPVSGATNVLGTGSIVTAIDRGNGCATSFLYRATVLEE